jgi:hypothetical protein
MMVATPVKVLNVHGLLGRTSRPIPLSPPIDNTARIKYPKEKVPYALSVELQDNGKP